MDDLIGLLRASRVMKALGLAFLALFGLHLLATGRVLLVLWALVGAAVVWGAGMTSNAERLMCATLASYAVGVAWLVQKWASPLLPWAGITVLVAAATVSSFRSKSRLAKTVCVVMIVALPQALWAAFIEQAFANWTMF